MTVYHKAGRVEKIETENGEPEFIVNIKKSLVSQLQHDLSKSLYSDESSNKVRRGDEEVYVPSFKTEETSILGNCETIYSVSRLPENLVQEFEEEEIQRRSRDWETRRVEEEENFVKERTIMKSLRQKILITVLSALSTTKLFQSALPLKLLITQLTNHSWPEQSSVVPLKIISSESLPLRT